MTAAGQVLVLAGPGPNTPVAVIMFILAKFVSDKVSLICEHTMQPFEYGTSLENFISGTGWHDANSDAEMLRMQIVMCDV